MKKIMDIARRWPLWRCCSYMHFNLKIRSMADRNAIYHDKRCKELLTKRHLSKLKELHGCMCEKEELMF